MATPGRSRPDSEPEEARRYVSRTRGSSPQDLSALGASQSPFVHEWLSWHALRSPESPAIMTPTMRLTYGELSERVQSLASHMAAAGVSHGSRVLLALPNGPAYVVASIAILSLGAMTVEPSRSRSPEEFSIVIARSGVRHAVVSAADASLLSAALVGQKLDHVVRVHRGPQRAKDSDIQLAAAETRLTEDGLVDPAADQPFALPGAMIDADTPALVLYTSGSTGRPLGVIQTHRNIDSNTRAITQYLGLTHDDRALIALPLAYCYARSVLHTHLLVGASVFLDDRTAFPRLIVESLASGRCTGFAGVPLTFEILRRQVDLSTFDLANLRYVTQAGGAMRPETAAWARSAFAPAQLFIMYGQTEATARLTYLPPDRAHDKPGSIGVPIPGVEIRIVDESGNEVAIGVVGELAARGANITPGYLDDARASASILRDGWLHTGDLATMDADGYLYVHGRIREILKVGGHRVSTAKIEQAITQHPAIDEAAVFGVAHDLLGEVPRAAVVSRPGSSISETDLARFCRARLMQHEVPVAFEFTRSLPRSHSGKLERARLAAMFGGDRTQPSEEDQDR